MNKESGQESPKRNMNVSGLRQSVAKKMLNNKEFVESLKLLTQTKHHLLLQCVLETLLAIPNM